MAKSRSQICYYNRLTGAEVYPYGWQLKIKKGDFFEIISECIPTIYGVILEPFREKGCYRVRAYSAQCPVGEEGALRIVEPTGILTKRQFEEARARNWMPDERNVQ
jgi:hypothetical protein